MRARSIAPFASASCSVRCVISVVPVAPLSLPTFAEDAAAVRCASPVNAVDELRVGLFLAPVDRRRRCRSPMLLDLQVHRCELRLQRRRRRARRRRARAQRGHARAHDQEAVVDPSLPLTPSRQDFLQRPDVRQNAIVRLVAVRPCVCRRELGHCDSSCSRDLLETTFFPTFMNVRDRTCLVIGAGPIGLEKIEGLLASDAHVVVVAPEAEPEVAELAAEGSLVWHQRRYEPDDLEGALLVFAATSDTDLNVRVFREAEARAMLVNVVDVPPLCNFIMPAIVRNGPVSIAISTSGASPALAKRLKREIAEEFGEPYARLAEMLNDIRGVGQGHVRDLPGAQGLLRGDRQRRARPDRAAAPGRRARRARADRRAAARRRVLARLSARARGRGARVRRARRQRSSSAAASAR